MLLVDNNARHNSTPFKTTFLLQQFFPTAQPLKAPPPPLIAHKHPSLFLKPPELILFHMPPLLSPTRDSRPVPPPPHQQSPFREPTIHLPKPSDPNHRPRTQRQPRTTRAITKIPYATAVAERYHRLDTTGHNEEDERVQEVRQSKQANISMAENQEQKGRGMERRRKCEAVQDRAGFGS
ncbi:MAG: hypothetical protein Q9190_002087 [Brigantiaea leucoxantha]